jgi:fumarate hydratase subunit alpha
MKEIHTDAITGAVEQLCYTAAYDLPKDVEECIRANMNKEESEFGKYIFEQILENVEYSRKERVAICQDTGAAVFFVELGQDVHIVGGSLTDAINEGVWAGYEKGYLRRSIVADPLNRRVNTGTNTPAVVHLSLVPGDRLKLTVMAKGGGCENKSQFRMFRPTADKQQIVEWVVSVVREAGADACPPFVVGVGLGGNFEASCLLSKKALLRRLDERHADPFYAQMERDLLAQVNALGLGPQGLGGDTTALAVLIETAPCHIASLPAAVNIECHSHRHKTASL